MEGANYCGRCTPRRSFVCFMVALVATLIFLIWLLIFAIVEVYTKEDIQGAWIVFVLLVILGLVISALVLSILERILRNGMGIAQNPPGFACCVYDGSSGSCVCCVRDHHLTSQSIYENMERGTRGTYPGISTTETPDSTDPGSSYTPLQMGLQYVPHPPPHWNNGDREGAARGDEEDDEPIYETMA